MSAANPALDWINRAEEDFEVARLVLRRKRVFPAAACFHAQQAAEKYWKALLTAQGAVFPYTHDLVVLAQLLTNTGLLVPVSMVDLSDLAQYAVEARYPGTEPTASQAQAALAVAASTRRYVRRSMGLR